MDSAPLQPLRIPQGWFVLYNNAFYELDPLPDNIPEDDRWVFFKEDMLTLRHEHRNRLLDLCWLPEGDFENGSYKLALYRGDFRGRLLHKFRTRDRLEVVAEIERILQLVIRGQL